jgi:Ni/Co efflux regulator RcnB
MGGVQGGHQSLQFHQHALRSQDQGRSYYSRGAFQAHVVVTNRFHVGGWSRPSGWYYRPWAYGMFLPFGWFGPAYYLNWGIYDLPPPPIGCEWVRQGPDAVLVDIWTGEILSVYSGVFY